MYVIILNYYTLKNYNINDLPHFIGKIDMIHAPDNLNLTRTLRGQSKKDKNHTTWLNGGRTSPYKKRSVSQSKYAQTRVRIKVAAAYVDQ